MNNLKKVLPKIGVCLQDSLENADEIWIAVALMTNSGLRNIVNALPKTCVQHYLLGIDLPTDPEVFQYLYSRQNDTDVNVHLYMNVECYHPKVYLIRKRNNLEAYIGSANATNGGFHNNIELSFRIDTPGDCWDIRNWFEALYVKGVPITSDFLAKYKEDYRKRKERKKSDEQIVRTRKKAINSELAAVFQRRAALVTHLKKFKSGSTYKSVKKSKAASIQRLKESLDYPVFKKVNIDTFFGEYDLGHIIAIPKNRIKKAIPKFTKILQCLFNDDEDIAVRYDRVDSGELKFNGISKGLISKLLTMHDPNQYYVANDHTNLALREYGIQLPRGISKGEKYKITRNVLNEICRESGIENFAILDHCLYEVGRKLKTSQNLTDNRY